MTNRYDYTRMGPRFDWGFDNPDYGQGRPTPRGYYNRPLTRRLEPETGYWDRPFSRSTDYDYDPYNLDFGTEPTFEITETWWWVPGPFTGLGPEGYQRSDDRILEDVNDRLLQHGNIDARNIHVDVTNGEVTLTGSVTDRHTKRLVEDVTESVIGVTDVHNNLRLLNKAGQPTSGQSGSTHGLTVRPDLIRPGMTVVDLDNKKIGKIKDVRDKDFLIDRPTGPGLYVPFNVAHLNGDTVMLTVTSDAIDNQNWPTTEKVGSQMSGRR